MSLRSRLLELVLDPTTDRVSQSKLWANVASAAAVVIFVRMGWNAGPLSDEAFAIFLAGMCGNAAVSKLLSLKYGGGAPAAGDKAGA